jgi:hypothetical protein
VSLSVQKHGVKSLDRDVAIALWGILLEGRFGLIEEWSEYVETHHKHAITRDEWMQTFEFVHQIDIDLASFDDNGESVCHLTPTDVFVSIRSFIEWMVGCVVPFMKGVYVYALVYLSIHTFWSIYGIFE